MTVNYPELMVYFAMGQQEAALLNYLVERLRGWDQRVVLSISEAAQTLKWTESQVALAVDRLVKSTVRLERSGSVINDVWISSCHVRNNDELLISIATWLVSYRAAGEMAKIKGYRI